MDRATTVFGKKRDRTYELTNPVVTRRDTVWPVLEKAFDR
jgi:hypothetical protein